MLKFRMAWTYSFFADRGGGGGGKGLGVEF